MTEGMELKDSFLAFPAAIPLLNLEINNIMDHEVTLSWDNMHHLEGESIKKCSGREWWGWRALVNVRLAWHV